MNDLYYIKKNNNIMIPHVQRQKNSLKKFILFTYSVSVVKYI